MLDKRYVTVVESVKEQIRCAKHKAILNANKELIILYWNIGKVICENSTWGSMFLKIVIRNQKRISINKRIFGFKSKKYGKILSRIF